MKSLLLKFANSFFVLKKFEPLRYLIIGGSCSVGHIIFLYFLTDIVGIYYLFSTMASFISASIFGYFGHKYFTYRNFESKHAKQLSLYYSVIFIGLALDAGLMYIFVSKIGIYYLFASIITKFIILIVNFSWGKYITFKKSEVNISIPVKPT